MDEYKVQLRIDALNNTANAWQCVFDSAKRLHQMAYDHRGQPGWREVYEECRTLIDAGLLGLRAVDLL